MPYKRLYNALFADHPDYKTLWAEYLEVCKKTNEKPNRSDFFGWLQGLANDLPALVRPDYDSMWAWAVEQP